MEKTLRDEIAIAALAALLEKRNASVAVIHADKHAQDAYKIADAMLGAREK